MNPLALAYDALISGDEISELLGRSQPGRRVEDANRAGWSRASGEVLDAMRAWSLVAVSPIERIANEAGTKMRDAFLLSSHACRMPASSVGRG